MNLRMGREHRDGMGRRGGIVTGRVWGGIRKPGFSEQQGMSGGCGGLFHASGL